MLTIFSSPKPAQGAVRQHQENAIASWRSLGMDVQIILAAPANDLADLAQKYQCDVLPQVACNTAGVPILSDLFAQAAASARHDILVYVNADIILSAGLIGIVKSMRSKFNEFLLIGGRTNIHWDNPLPVNWPEILARTAQQENAQPTRWGSDYFIFTKNYYAAIKPFILGRFYWDNWLIYEGCRLAKPVINITHVYTVYHPHHDYAHAATSEAALWQHPDTIYNHQLMPNPMAHHTVEDASYLLGTAGQLYGWRHPSLAYVRMRLRGLLGRVKLAFMKIIKT